MPRKAKPKIQWIPFPAISIARFEMQRGKSLGFCEEDAKIERFEVKSFSNVSVFLSDGSVFDIQEQKLH